MQLQEKMIHIVFLLTCLISKICNRMFVPKNGVKQSLRVCRKKHNFCIFSVIFYDCRFLNFIVLFVVSSVFLCDILENTFTEEIRYKM